MEKGKFYDEAQSSLKAQGWRAVSDTIAVCSILCKAMDMDNSPPCMDILNCVDYLLSMNRIFRERRGRKSDIPQDSIAWTKSVSMYLRSPELVPFTYTRGSTIAPRYLRCDWSFYCKLASNWSLKMVHVYNRCFSFLSMDTRKVPSHGCSNNRNW